MDGTGRTEREGRRKVLLAVAAGGLAFPCWLALPVGGGFFGYAGSDLVELLPSAHPTTLEFMRWAGAGIMAGLVTACLAPRWRWIIVPPFLVLLEIGWLILIFLGVGAGDIPVPPGALLGMCAGVVLGVLAVTLCRPGMQPRGRRATLALALVALLSVPAISAWRGRGELAAMRARVLPTVEKLLGSDVLMNTTPVQWIAVRRRVADPWADVAVGPEDGNIAVLEKPIARVVERVLVGVGDVYYGALYWHAYGEMRSPKAQISLNWYGLPALQAAPARGLEGLKVEGMEVNLATPQPFDPFELSQQHDVEVIKRLLQSAGVRPELVERIELWQESAPPDYDAIATRHGIRYEFHWHVANYYEFERMQFPLDAVLITCSGTYSASAP